MFCAVHGHFPGVQAPGSRGKDTFASLHGQQEVPDYAGVRRDAFATVEGHVTASDKIVFRRLHGNGPVAVVHQEEGRVHDGQEEQFKNEQICQHGEVRPTVRGVRDAGG